MGALREAYENRMFIGGRGTGFFVQNGMNYTNHCFSPEDDFKSFSGIEQVMCDDRELVGFHHYRGMLLFHSHSSQA